MHTIQTLCRAAGLNPSTIRTWERRYGVPKPWRLSNGQRRYSDEEVRRIQLLCELLARGGKIGDIASLDIEALEAVVEQSPPPAERNLDKSALNRCIGAVSARDAVALRRELGLAIIGLPPITLIEDVLVPLLHFVGDQWEQNKLPIAVEHVVSTLIKQAILGASAQQGWDNAGPALVFGTLANERHEFGALFAWYLANGCGYRAVYLGSDLPTREIAGAANLFDANFLVLSSVLQDATIDVRKEVSNISALVSASTEVWIGHPGGEDALSPLPANTRAFSSYRDFLLALRLIKQRPVA